MSKKYTIEIFEDCSGLTEVQSFQLSGVACDIRNKNNLERLDLALIHTPSRSVCAGVFTTNDVKAAPVVLDIEHLKKRESIRAIVANSGNANACTGDQGFRDAKSMCSAVAKALNVSEEEVLVCSTGRIGELLPMEKILNGIDLACKKLSTDKQNGLDAANAILTSDTKIKVVKAVVDCSGKKFVIAGMSKGAGMIEPNMATMLAFIASDVEVSQPLLKETLKYASNKSFNRITVDGDMSTNDTVLMMCNGTSGVKISGDNESLADSFREALTKICQVLARKIVGDGERITKVVDVVVKKAKTSEQAEKICRAIGNSLLVKSSWYGSDPNWGRLADAAGYARTGLDYYKMDLYYDNVQVLDKGQPLHENKEKWKKIVSKKEFTIEMILNQGDCEEAILSTDLSEAYVDFNKGE